MSLEVAIHDISDVEKELHVEVTTDELKPHFEKAYERECAKLEIKGFRKGKAPLDLVKRMFGESIEYDALNSIASDIYRNITEEKSIEPLGEPVLVDMNYKRGETFSFKVKYEIKPEFTLEEYKGTPIEKLVHPLSDEEVEEEIRRLRKSNQTLEPADTAADDQHLVTVDVQELDENGTPVIGKRSPGMKVDLSDESVVTEVRDALAGVRAGDVRRAKFETAHKDHVHQHHLELTVTGIERILLPELNEELVKKITREKVSNVEEFRTGLKEDIASYWAEQSERRFVESIINELVERHPFTVPESFVKVITDSRIEEIRNQNRERKLPPTFNEAEFRKEFHDAAAHQAKWFLIRERIIAAEGLTVSDTELEEQAALDAPKMGIDKERLLTFYKTSDSVKDRILSDKVIKLLKESVKVIERPDTVEA